MKIFDTHAHYDSGKFEDRDELLSAVTGDLSVSKGIAPEKEEIWQVSAVVNVGASFDGAVKSLELAHTYQGVYAACGVHPDEVGELEADEARECDRKTGKAGDTGNAEDIRGEERKAEEAVTGYASKFTRLEKMCLDSRCVAVGEIGLDYHWMVQPRELQQKWFIRQLALSEKLHLPINVHSRDAAADTFNIIKEYHAQYKEGGIIHCYSGSVEMAREYVKMGYHLGIGGVVTFKNGRVLKEVVKEIPLEWLVTETDCPYLAPEPYRGRRNDSRKIRYVIEAIAQIKGIQTEEAARQLFENALRVYRLV